MKHRLIYSLFVAMLSLCSPALAQQFQQPYQQVSLLNDGQLSQLVAPIALYPDPILSQILMASTYPSDIVDAAIWLQNPDNAAMQGDVLAAALQQLPWDPSVKALIVFPQTIQMMNNYLQWTEQLGNSFLNQQAAVMDTIQGLRQQAVAAGTLATNLEQTVSTTQDQIVLITPTDPQAVYIPYYNPAIAYGGWNYPQYPPYYLQTVNTNTADPIIYGPAVIVYGSLRNWTKSDWHNHRILVDNRRYRGPDNQPGTGPGTWQHNPQHQPPVVPPAQNVRPPQFTTQPVQQPVIPTARQMQLPVTTQTRPQNTPPRNNAAVLPPVSTGNNKGTPEDPKKKDNQAY